MPASAQTQAIIEQGRLVLTSLTALLYISTITAIDVGLRTGELQAMTVDPVVRTYTAYQDRQESIRQEKAAAAQKAREIRARKAAAAREQKQSETQQQSETRIIINTTTQPSKTHVAPSTPAPQPAPQQAQPNFNQSPSYNPGSWESDYEARVKQMQEEADRRYEESLKDQDAWAEEQKKASQDRLDALRAESEADYEAWKAENGL